MPEETAVKWMKWKLPGKGYEETEQNLMYIGLNFANDNLGRIFAISMTKTEIARYQGFKILNRITLTRQMLPRITLRMTLPRRM